VYGKLYNSQTVWYKVTGLGDYVQPIGKGRKESVANTAVERQTNLKADYAPENLKTFVAEGGPVTAIVTEPPIETVQ